MTERDIFYSVEFLTEFLNLYRHLPCLWKVKCRDYRNRMVRNMAVDVLVEKSQTIWPAADRDYVLKRVNNLRSSFRKELKKVAEARRADLLYQPTLWYYELLAFTAEQDQEELDNSLWADVKKPLDIATQSPALSEFKEQMGPESLVGHGARKRKWLVPKEEALVEEEEERPDRSEDEQWRLGRSEDDNWGPARSKDEHWACGVIVAAKLRDMDRDQSLLAENLIHQTLFLGVMKRLTPSTTVTVHPPVCIYKEEALVEEEVETGQD